MGIFSWFRGSSKANLQLESKPAEAAKAAPGMDGALEVPRPESVTVFEFGTVAGSADSVTLAGYCPVSDDLEPCRWEIVPAADSDAPQFRVVF